MNAYFTAMALVALAIPLLGSWLDRRDAGRAAGDLGCWCDHLVEDSHDFTVWEREFAVDQDRLTALVDEVWPDGAR